jgi:hypothetical protein
MAKQCFQKTLVLVFQRGKIQAERTPGYKWGLLKVREREIQREHGAHRWNPPAERACFSFSGAFKTYTNPWEGRPRRFPPNNEQVGRA